MGDLGLSLEEYYPWRKNSVVKYPWEREYLNQQFLNYEIKRLKTLSDWYKKIFMKAKIGSKVGDVSFYAVPVELDSSWKLAVSEFGEMAETDDIKYMGLSALYNSPQVIVFAIFPYNVPIPYNLIYVEEAKKVVIYNRRLNQPEYCMWVEKWNPLSSDSIYLDVPYEKGVISKVISEIVGGENNLALSFQSPILSAPYLEGSIGGISLSSFTLESSFAKELVKMMKILVPPEYRNPKLPKRLINGYKFTKIDGLKFHFAERPVRGKNFFSGQYGSSYNMLKKELAKRFSFRGEYSIFSTLVPSTETPYDVWIQLLKNFSSTEVTLPYNLNELVDADIDLTKFKKEINEEDIWVQIVHARQLNPYFGKRIDKNFSKTLQLLEKDFDTLLSDIHGETERKIIVKDMLIDIGHNLVRISQSFARSDEKKEIAQIHIKNARSLILDNFQGFLENPKVSATKYVVGRNKKRNIKYSSVRVYLINHPSSTVEEIFEGIKDIGIFENISNLQEYLGWLHIKGRVIRDM